MDFVYLIINLSWFCLHIKYWGLLYEILFVSVSFLGKFQEFDYGPVKNVEHYGQSEPPDYNLKNITAPISLHYGTGDLIVSPEVS